MIAATIKINTSTRIILSIWLRNRTVPASITKWKSNAKKKYLLCLNFTANQTSTDKETCAIKADMRSTPLNKNT